MRYIVFLILLLVGSHVIGKPRVKVPLLTPHEKMGILAEMTPDSVAIIGSAQGFGLFGDYGILVRDKGQCNIIDFKQKKMVNCFQLNDNQSHCNNLNFGKQWYSKDSDFPLAYISECTGERACLVTDIRLNGENNIVQRIVLDNSGYPRHINYFLDTRNDFLYTYGGLPGYPKTIKKFKMPRLEDSDEKGYVHLTPEDVLDSFVVKKLNIGQGSYISGNYLFLPDGAPALGIKMHIVDLSQKKVIKTFDWNSFDLEPEGLCVKDGWLWVAFHAKKQPRLTNFYRFKM